LKGEREIWEGGPRPEKKEGEKNRRPIQKMIAPLGEISMIGEKT